MKVIALIGLFSSFNLMAAGLPEVDIQNLSGQYSLGMGTASASHWQLPDEATINNAQFTVLKEQDTFVFSGDGGDFTLENLPDLILEMEKLNWSKGTFKTTPQSIDLTLSSLIGNNILQSIRTNSLAVSCRGNSSAVSTRDVALENCIKKASLKASLIEFTSKGKSEQQVEAIFAAILNDQLASKTGLENLNFSMSNGSFEFKVRAKLDVSANLKGEGKIELRGAPGARELRVRIDKVKASFLNVTKKVFKALEDNPMDGVRVSRPYVIIELDS